MVSEDEGTPPNPGSGEAPHKLCFRPRSCGRKDLISTIRAVPSASREPEGGGRKGNQPTRNMKGGGGPGKRGALPARPAAERPGLPWPPLQIFPQRLYLRPVPGQLDPAWRSGSSSANPRRPQESQPGPCLEPQLLLFPVWTGGGGRSKVRMGWQNRVLPPWLTTTALLAWSGRTGPEVARLYTDTSQSQGASSGLPLLNEGLSFNPTFLSQP